MGAERALSQPLWERKGLGIKLRSDPESWKTNHTSFSPLVRARKGFSIKRAGNQTPGWNTSCSVVIDEKQDGLEAATGGTTAE